MQIVVAHPDEEVRRLVALSLREDRHHVATLRHSDELVACLSRWASQGARPDLLVVADRLGSRSGAEVATAIRGTSWDAPVILLLDEDGADGRGDVSAADAVFCTPFDPDDLRTVALCLRRKGGDGRRGDRQRDTLPAPEPTEMPGTSGLPEPAGLRVEMVFRGVPLLDDLVYRVRERAARLATDTGVRGRCAVSVQAAWRHEARVFVTEVDLEVRDRQPMRLSRSDYDLFSTIDSAFDALRRVLSAREDSPLSDHDGWQPVRKRITPLPEARVRTETAADNAGKWEEEPSQQVSI